MLFSCILHMLFQPTPLPVPPTSQAVSEVDPFCGAPTNVPCGGSGADEVAAPVRGKPRWLLAQISEACWMLVVELGSLKVFQEAETRSKTKRRGRFSDPGGMKY